MTCVASGVSLIPSTYMPNPGAEVTFHALGAPTGAQFSWDFDGDGRPELTTHQPQAKWAVPPGYWEVALEVIQGGKVLARARTAVVADARLGAVRSAHWVSGALEVTVVVRAKTTLIVPGLQETIPPGWVAVVVDDGGAIFRIGDLLEALWPTILDPGWEVKLVYRLHPPSPGAAPKLSGKASGYVGGARVEVLIAGPLTF